MKMNNMQIIERVNGLSELIKEAPDIRVRNSHVINRNYKKLLEAYMPYDEDRNKIMASDKTDEEKVEAQRELLEAETDVNIDMITLSDLENEPLNLKQVNVIDFMVTESGVQE